MLKVSTLVFVKKGYQFNLQFFFSLEMNNIFPGMYRMSQLAFPVKNNFSEVNFKISILPLCNMCLLLLFFIFCLLYLFHTHILYI